MYKDKQNEATTQTVNSPSKLLSGYAQALLLCYMNTPRTDDAYVVIVRCECGDFSYPFNVSKSLTREQQIASVLSTADDQHFQYDRPAILCEPFVIRITPEVVADLQAWL
jgi:hypothetical protein